MRPWGLAASVPIPDLSGEHAARPLAHGQAALAQGRQAAQPAADNGRPGHQDHGGGGIPQEVQARPHRRNALARSRPHECGHPPLQKPARAAWVPKRELRRRSGARPQSPMLPAWTTQEHIYGQDRVLTGTPRDAHSQHGRIGGICQEPVRERQPMRCLHGTHRRTNAPLLDLLPDLCVCDFLEHGLRNQRGAHTYIYLRIMTPCRTIAGLFGKMWKGRQSCRSESSFECRVPVVPHGLREFLFP